MATITHIPPTPETHAPRPEMPWYGYDLGEWNDYVEGQAQRAVRGDYWETGRWCAEHRRSDVSMNTEMRTLDSERSRQ